MNAISKQFAPCLAIPLILFANQCSFAESQQTAEQGKSPKIYVLVYNYAPLPSQLLHRAEEQASQIFRRAGVEIIWVDQSSLRHRPGRYSLKDMDLILRILPQPRATLSSQTALGEALPCQVGQDLCLASVFYSRVQQLVQNRIVPLNIVLGHAMAHELGHLLLGSNSHDESGLMQANWNRRELERAARGELRFTAEQARLIRTEVLKGIRSQKTPRLFESTPQKPITGGDTNRESSDVPSLTNHSPDSRSFVGQAF
jgi:hypothetical protein